MGPEHEQPTPGPRTRRSMREAERRAAAQTTSAVLTPPGVPVTPDPRRSVTGGPALPTWSQSRAAGPGSAPAVRSTLPAPGARTSQPRPVARSTAAPAAAGAAPQQVSAPRAVASSPSTMSPPVPAPKGGWPTTASLPPLAPTTSRTVAAPPAPASHGPVTSAPAPQPSPDVRPTGSAASAGSVTAPRTSVGGWPSWGSASPVAPSVPASATETAVLAPLLLDDALEPQPDAAPVTRPSTSPEPCEAAAASARERATRATRTGTDRPGGRRTSRMPRAAVRFGVLGALAGVTVVIPTVSQGGLDGVALPGMSSSVASSELPDTVSALTASSLSILPPSSLISIDGAIAAREAAAGASRSAERSALPGCDGTVRAAGANGLLKTSDLCTLWDGNRQLRADAAVSLAEFNQAFVARFGADLCLSSGYRSLAQQRSVKAQKGGLAAAPGKSNHGWGLAVDLCQNQTSGAKWTWISENGPTFGWENPAWAKRGGSGPYEPWHWEYTKGVKADGEYYDD